MNPTVRTSTTHFTSKELDVTDGGTQELSAMIQNRCPRCSEIGFLKRRNTQLLNARCKPLLPFVYFGIIRPQDCRRALCPLDYPQTLTCRLCLFAEESDRNLCRSASCLSSRRTVGHKHSLPKLRKDAKNFMKDAEDYSGRQ